MVSNEIPLSATYADGILFGLRSTAILSTTSLYLLFTVIHFLLLLIGGKIPSTQNNDQFLSDIMEIQLFVR